MNTPPPNAAPAQGPTPPDSKPAPYEVSVKTLDATGRGRLQSKLEHHRNIRKNTLHKDRNPNGTYEECTGHLGNLATDLIAIFEAAWKRKAPQEPDEEAGAMQAEMAKLIDNELRLMDAEVRRLWGTDFEQNAKTAEKGIEKLKAAIDVHKNRCFEAIDNLRADRKAVIKHRQGERWERNLDRGLALASGAAVALLSVFATNHFQKGDAAAYRNELSAIRVAYENQVGVLRDELKGMRQSTADEIKGLRRANEATGKELASLRGDYRQFISWTMKTPEQLDREIARLKDALEVRKTDLQREFAQKRGKHHRDMAERGLLDSGMTESGAKQITLEEAEAIKAAERNTQHVIDDLLEQRRKTLR